MDVVEMVIVVVIVRAIERKTKRRFGEMSSS